MAQSLVVYAGTFEPESVDSDEAVVAAAQVDRAAFAVLYRRYATDVYRYCFRRLGSREAAEDATSQIETLRAITIDPAQIGAAPADSWTQAAFDQVIVEPGESFSTDDPFFGCCGGVVLFFVIDGSANIVAHGDISIFPADSSLPPVMLPAGSSFELVTGESAAFARHEPVVVRNTSRLMKKPNSIGKRSTCRTSPEGSSTICCGSIPAQMVFQQPASLGQLSMLAAFGHNLSLGPDSDVNPEGYKTPSWAVDMNFESMPAGPIVIAFERIPLGPGQLTHLSYSEAETILGWHSSNNATLRMAPGLLDALPAGAFSSTLVEGFTMGYFDTGDYTFFNSSEHSTALYLMRLSSSAAPEDATADDHSN